MNRRWGVPSHVKWLIRVLELFASPINNKCAPSVREIGLAAEMNDDQVRTLLTVASDLELVVIEPHPEVNGEFVFTLRRETYLKLAEVTRPS